jgi:2-methylisocitrate lyase-like PEP mutase family enzyme
MAPQLRLANRLKAPGIVVAPGCHDALAAKVFARAGFEAVYMTGNGLSASLIGAPDIGLLTMTEMVARARAIAAAVDVPLIADADTGYGNVNNVARTVAEFEAAGAAAIHLEDQVTPKRCGAMAGLALIPKEEHAEKIAAAVKARTRADFLIIGRSDARIPLGLADAIERGRAYAAAGADLVLLEMLQSEEEMREALRRIDAPLMFNYVENKVPALTVQRFGELGFRVVCYPVSSTLAYAHLMERFASLLKASGTTAGLAKEMLSLRDYEQLLDRPRYA